MPRPGSRGRQTRQDQTAEVPQAGRRPLLERQQDRPQWSGAWPRRPAHIVRATGSQRRSKAEGARQLGVSDSYLAAQTGRAPDQLRSIPDAEPPRPDGPAGPDPALEQHVRPARDAGLATPMANPAPRAYPARRWPEEVLGPGATRATSALLCDRQATARRHAELLAEWDPNPARGDRHILVIPPEREEAAS